MTKAKLAEEREREIKDSRIKELSHANDRVEQEMEQTKVRLQEVE